MTSKSKPQSGRQGRRRLEVSSAAPGAQAERSRGVAQSIATRIKLRAAAGARAGGNPTCAALVTGPEPHSSTNRTAGACSGCTAAACRLGRGELGTLLLGRRLEPADEFDGRSRCWPLAQQHRVLPHELLSLLCSLAAPWRPWRA